MYLTEVNLKNWRSYRSAMFRFPAPTAKKKVILVGAMNGTGKTSLLASLYLGLFGRDGMYYVEGVKLSDVEEEKQRSYRFLMERVLHRGALQEDDPQISVQLSFDIGEDNPLTITRTWHFFKRGKLRDLNTNEGEEVIIYHNNKPKKFASWQEANNRIEDLLFPATSFVTILILNRALMASSGASFRSLVMPALFDVSLARCPICLRTNGTGS